MKPMQCITRRMYTGLFLGFILVAYPTAAVVAAPQFEAAQPVPPQDDTDRKDNTDRKDVLPLPEAGETAHFRYERDRSGMYWIIPTDGSQSYLVSASFLQVTIDSPQLNSFQQAELLRTYPTLMQQMFTKIMAQAYPDGTAEYAVPFVTQSFEGTDGTQALLEQDPAAAPYIRVRLTGGGGETVEFSMARAVVEQMLANERFATDDQLLQGLRSFPFRLPETARVGNFARLSTAELAMLVQQEPELRRYEFIQMGQLSRDGAEDRSAETLRQQRKPRMGQRPATALPSAVPLGVPQRPALAQPPQPPTTSGTGEQPQSDPGAYIRGIDGLSPQVAKPLQRSPDTRAEAASTDGRQTSVMYLGLRIVAISLFALGIIALVVSRRTR